MEDRAQIIEQSDKTPRRVTFRRPATCPKICTGDKLLAKLLSRLPEPYFGLQGVYRFTDLSTLHGGQLDANDGTSLADVIQAGPAGSYVSLSTAREYADSYVRDIGGLHTGVQYFIRQLIKAAIFSGTRNAKRDRDYAEFVNKELPVHSLVSVFQSKTKDIIFKLSCVWSCGSSYPAILSQSETSVQLSLASKTQYYSCSLLTNAS